ncbi:hypothetical protein, partial [Streptomyces sp. NPDC007856]|uniref:hypothetical protein n=1 Tax=Streptomyces sp. NPDC007856 TaxID=3364781 RepID=UPI0036B797F4
LVGDLDVPELLAVLDRAEPGSLGVEGERAVEQQWWDQHARIALQGMARGESDRSVLADMPTGVVRALMSGFVPPVLTPGQRDVLRAPFRRVELAAELLGVLRSGGPSGEDSWRRLLEIAHPAWAAAPHALDLQAVAGASSRQMRERALQDTLLWTTPFYDQAPVALAQYLDVDLVIVRDGQEDQHLNPGATRTLYVYYNGTDHYSGLHHGPAGQAQDMDVDTPAAVIAEPATGTRTTLMDTPVPRPTPGPVPETGADPHAMEFLEAFARTHAPDVSDHFIARLATLSPEALHSLFGQATNVFLTQFAGADAHPWQTSAPPEQTEVSFPPFPDIAPSSLPQLPADFDYLEFMQNSDVFSSTQDSQSTRDVEAPHLNAFSENWPNFPNFRHPYGFVVDTPTGIPPEKDPAFTPHPPPEDADTQYNTFLLMMGIDLSAPGIDQNYPSDFPMGESYTSENQADE